MKFTSADKEILKIGLTILPFLERQILIYRFWENFEIEEIAHHLEMEWSEINRSIEDSLQKLRIFCQSFPEFSVKHQIDIAA